MPERKNEIDLARGERIKRLRKAKNLRQNELGALVGVTHTTIGNWENKGEAPGADNLIKLSEIFNESIDFILIGRPFATDEGFHANIERDVGVLPESGVARSKKTVSEKETVIKPVVVTVDHGLNEVITFVPERVQAGYLAGFSDPEFIEELPSFGFPGFNNGIFRAFEVEGYSMLQYEGSGLYPSDIVIAQYVENPKEMRDNRVYVVASDEGLLIKRCINRLESNGKLICNSDNKNGDYPPIILNAYQIKEVWEFKGKFSRQIPKATRVYEEISELQSNYTLVVDEVKKMKEDMEVLQRQIKIATSVNNKGNK